MTEANPTAQPPVAPRIHLDVEAYVTRPDGTTEGAPGREDDR